MPTDDPLNRDDPFQLDRMGEDQEAEAALMDADMGIQVPAGGGTMNLRVSKGDHIRIGDVSITVRQKVGTSKLMLAVDAPGEPISLYKNGQMKVGRR